MQQQLDLELERQYGLRESVPGQIIHEDDGCIIIEETDSQAQSEENIDSLDQKIKDR